MITRLRLHHLLPALAVGFLSLILALPAAAYETFKVAAPELGTNYITAPVAVGPTWAAYQSSSSQEWRNKILVMDTGTHQVLHDIPTPPNDTPIPGRPGWTRNTPTFGLKVVTDGTYIATYSNTSLHERTESGSLLQTKTGRTIHIWKMPGAQFIGAIDLDENATKEAVFVGIANGRIAHTRSGTRTIRQWDAASLAALPDITIPDASPAINNELVLGTIAMGGDDLVYQGLDTNSVNQLTHVNLPSGAVTQLPKTAGFETSAFRHLAVGSGHLLAPTDQTHYNSLAPPAFMLHYDLATAQVVAQTPIPRRAATRAFFAPDGASWRTVSSSYDDATSEVRSGSGPAVEGGEPFVLPPDPAPLWPDAAPEPYTYAQGHLWFHAGGTMDGTVAYRISAAVQPLAHLSSRCLPGHEADGHLQYVFTLSRPVDHDVTLHVRTLTGTGSATSGSDFVPFDGEVTIPANESRAVFLLPLVQDDAIEENETLVLEIAGHPAELQVSETQVPGIIGGSSFHRLPPVAAWQDTEPTARVEPFSIAVAGNHLVQMNKSRHSPIGDAPRVLTRPLDGSEWTPSAALASLEPYPMDLSLGGGITTGGPGLALFATANSVNLYNPATDTVLFERTETYLYPLVYMGDTRFLIFQLGGSLPGTVTEYPLSAPFSPSTPLASGTTYLHGPAAYASDFLIGDFARYGGSVRKISRTSRFDLGTPIAGNRWDPTYLAASGNYFAGADRNHVWFRHLDYPGSLSSVRLANGPLTNVTGIRMTANRIIVTDAPDAQPPSIRIFEYPSGLEVGMLLADRAADPSNSDFTALLPEGFTSSTGAPLPAAGYAFDGLSLSGKHLVAAVRWPELRETHLVAARFTQETGLPGIADPAPVREDAGALPLSLTEAAPFPITVTARAIVAMSNEDADWTGSGTTIVLPAGTTTFAPGMLPFDDQLPEGTVAAPLEITLSGNGITRTLRTAVQLLDDDQAPLAALPHTTADFGRDFAPAAGGWAYRADSTDENLVAWTGDAFFTHGSPFGADGSRAFATAMAGTGDWLAVTHQAWEDRKHRAKPSQIQIYQPGTGGPAPVRVLKGMKSFNNFGGTLFARDRTLWVGAPGSIYLTPKYKQTAGMVVQYDLPTGKKTRTFKAPKTHPVGFGSSITANETSVWIGSSANRGAVFQYTRDKGKLLRTLDKPEGGEPQQTFGSQLAANSSIVVLDSSLNGALPINLRGYAETTGELLWELTPPAGRHFGSFTLVGEEILATGGDSLIFYRLAPTGPPELLVEILIPGSEELNSTLDISKLQAANGQLALRRTQNGGLLDDAILLTLSEIEKLVPYLPAAPAATSLTESTRRATTNANAVTSVTTDPGSTPPPPALTLSQASAGNWQLHLPPAAEAAATAMTVECSTDLTQWHPFAAPAANGTTWQLVPATAPNDDATTSLPFEGATLVDGTAIQVPRNHPRLFFRLHTP